MLNIELKLIICLNDLCRTLEIVVAGTAHKRLPAGILGLLLKVHYPGVMVIAGQADAAHTWEHYKAAPDAEDREGRFFNTKAGRVLNEIFVSVARTTFYPIHHIHGILFSNNDIRYMCRISTELRRGR